MGPLRGGSLVKVSTNREGHASLGAIRGEGCLSFQNFVMRIFVTLLLFSFANEVFLFTYIDSIWCFVIGTWSFGLFHPYHDMVG